MTYVNKNEFVSLAKFLKFLFLKLFSQFLPSPQDFCLSSHECIRTSKVTAIVRTRGKRDLEFVFTLVSGG